MGRSLMLLLLLVAISSRSPPIFNYSYQVSFIETKNAGSKSHNTRAQFFYDPLNDRERIDRQTGLHDTFCNTIFPGRDTPCTVLIVGGRRWQIFPQHSVCCLCCTSAHGCGPLRPDWLLGADYQGEETLDGTKCEIWHKTGKNQSYLGFTTEDYLYTTSDERRIPRRLDEGEMSIANYDLDTFVKKDFEESVFALPPYCNSVKPTHCPLTSICGLLRQGIPTKGIPK